MASPHSFPSLLDPESLDMKRIGGLVACAECRKRRIKCDRKIPCSPCVRRGRVDICPTGDLGSIGRGKRIMRSDFLEISTLHAMRDRIKQLETAVAEAHRGESASPHPLLREDLLAIKLTIESAPTTLSQLAELADTFGALTVGASGTLKYFGPTAGPEALLSFQGGDDGNSCEHDLLFAHLIHSFPFAAGSTSSWDITGCLEILLGQLPSEIRAWALYDVYVADASWYGSPIMPNELHELLSYVYTRTSNLYKMSPHALACIFFAFALSALADVSISPYSAEADAYFDTGRTALTLQSVFGSTDLHTIQALALAGVWYLVGGARSSADSAWGFISMATGLCQTMRLHCEHEHMQCDDKTARRRRALFWEVYSLETYQSLSFARPLTIPPNDVRCEFPQDDDETMDSQGRSVHGFFHSRWRFTKEVLAPTAQTYTRAKYPTYAEVLELDRGLRQFIERTRFPQYHDGPRGWKSFHAYTHAHLVPRFAGNMMVYIHRSAFVQALNNNPLQPLAGPYATSFLAAYRGASIIIRSDVRSFSLFPDHFNRWPLIWKGLINACFIVGSIVAKSPKSALAPTAFVELAAAVELVERGAVHSTFAESSLPVLHRLRNKATAVYAASRPFDAPPQLVVPSELADERDFELLGGSHAIVEHEAIRPRSGSTVHHIFTSDTISQPELWYAQVPETWFPGLQLGTLIGMPSAASTDAGQRGLEEYLAAQMQMHSTHTPHSESHQQNVIEPKMQWEDFLDFIDH
ncbi:fungal-specific transcription factor domain-containing protein [Mycena polygramma]|nr:fungal-specific transcription factor domain-containing protein [Mycena polygramma]